MKECNGCNEEYDEETKGYQVIENKTSAEHEFCSYECMVSHILKV